MIEHIGFLKMGSGAVGEVPGPFGSILDMVAAWKRPKNRRFRILGSPMGAPKGPLRCP